MPIIKSAKKAARQAEKRTAHNVEIKKAIKAAFDELIKAGYTGGHITIAHRNNGKFIEQFSALIREKFAQASIEVLPTSGLCSFYAEEGGLLMGYEI